MLVRLLPLILLALLVSPMFAQVPPIEPGVPQSLAKWRAANYSDVRYKLNLTLEKMSPVLKGTIEIRVNVGTRTPSSAMPAAAGAATPIVLDWRMIKGHEEKSTVSNVSINGVTAVTAPPLAAVADGGVRVPYEEGNEHLIFREGVVAGENVIKLDFTSPILTSGSAITRYVDKEDGSEYVYSLFVPSDASTAFPVFDQPDLKARFQLNLEVSNLWGAVSNTNYFVGSAFDLAKVKDTKKSFRFRETEPISTYVFAFAAGDFDEFVEGFDKPISELPLGEWTNEQTSKVFDPTKTKIYVRRSQSAKFKPHAEEVFRLNREGVKFLEQYFAYKFPFPKYDLVLIPEFPFGGMEHAGATFLREDRVIFPTEPTKNDYITRANLIFHEAAHQWFGDTVTMRWFDDLWLKEGFAEFMAYKTLEKVMPEYNAWKVFYERNKQAAYLTDSTKGTTPIYQEIPNLSAAKSAYGNIVYRKAPSFLKQAEFYIGPDKFQTAVRAFLKKHEFGNAGWEDLVKEFETASDSSLNSWASTWVKQPGLPTFRLCIEDYSRSVKTTGLPGEIKLLFSQSGLPCNPPMNRLSHKPIWPEALQFYYVLADGRTRVEKVSLGKNDREIEEIWGYNFGGLESKGTKKELAPPKFVFTNYQDHGYGIFLLDDKSRDYVLKNIQNEKDDFLRTMMWGSLWDSVREAELDPKEYVELVIKNINAETDESTIATLLNRVSTAMTYYLSDTEREALVSKVETLLIGKMLRAATPGQRITYYRALVNIASTKGARKVIKEMLASGGNLSGSEGVSSNARNTLPTGRVSASQANVPLKTKDKFDIVTRLLILGDPEAPKLLAELEKTETSDETKRYAYAAKAGIATAEYKAKFWNDFVNNKTISESWIEAAFGPFNSVRHADLTLPYLERALKELPNHKRNRKIFFVNGWLAAFIGGQRSEEALNIVNKFLADNPDLDRDLRLKILENVDVIERAVKIRKKFST